MSGASVRPPLLWSVFGPSSVCFFFSLALSGFARSGLDVLVMVFSPFPFLCVPRFVSRLGNRHLIFIVISLSFPFHLPCCCRACVCAICRDVKLRCVAGGMAAVSLAMPAKLWDSAGRECGRTFLYLQI